MHRYISSALKQLDGWPQIVLVEDAICLVQKSPSPTSVVGRAEFKAGQGRLGTYSGAPTKWIFATPPLPPIIVYHMDRAHSVAYDNSGPDSGRGGQTLPLHQKGPAKWSFATPPPRKKCVWQLTSPLNISCTGAPTV